MKMTRWTITVAYAAGIFYISMIPVGSEVLFPYSDKIFHFVIYAGFAILVVWSLRVTSLRPWPHVPMLAAAVAIAYGAVNELHQLYIPQRSAELLDLVANALGATAGVIVAMAAARALERRKEVCLDRIAR